MYFASSITGIMSPELASRIISGVTKDSETYNMFVAASLQALISKSPFLDQKGEHGISISEEELAKFKDAICKTALEYAQRMMSEREIEFERFKTFLPDNDNKKPIIKA